jgi:hypothetical protein
MIFLKILKIKKNQLLIYLFILKVLISASADKRLTAVMSPS